MAKVNLEQIEHAVRLILEAIGDDPNREGVLDTQSVLQNVRRSVLRYA